MPLGHVKVLDIDYWKSGACLKCHPVYYRAYLDIKSRANHPSDAPISAGPFSPNGPEIKLHLNGRRAPSGGNVFLLLMPLADSLFSYNQIAFSSRKVVYDIL